MIKLQSATQQGASSAAQEQSGSLAYHVNQRADGGKQTSAPPTTRLRHFPLLFRLRVGTEDRDDSGSSLAASAVTRGDVAMLSRETTCGNATPEQKGNAFPGLINVICIWRMKLIPIGGRFST